MVKAGEIGGVLDQVLQRLVEYLASAEELRDEVISALTYPMILVGVGGVSVAILLIFVLPKFATMFADLGQTLPLSTRMMLSISDAATSPWSLIGVPLIGGALFAGYRYVATKKRMAFDAFKLRTPLVGNLLLRTEVARFSRTLGVLLRSGVPMLQALDIVRAISNNQVIAAVAAAALLDASFAIAVACSACGFNDVAVALNFPAFSFARATADSAFAADF